MNHLIVSCSLSATSRSALLADYLAAALSTPSNTVETLNLREFDLPLCDGGPAFGHTNVQRLGQMIADADSVTLAVPIYNYGVGATARNLLALAGEAWTEKVVGFIGASGGDHAYMAIMGLANSLMLDFRSVIVPRYVYASREQFPGGQPADEVARRLDALALDLDRFASAFQPGQPAPSEG